MTTGFFSRATATTRDSLLGGKTVRTPVALPADVGDAQRSLSVGAGSEGLTRPRITVPAGDKRRLGTLIGGLAAIFLVLTIAGVAARHIHVTPVTTTPSTPAAAGAGAGAATGAKAPRANATDVSRLAGATIAVASATGGLHAQLATFGALPTPQQVSTVTVPYVDTLDLYQTVLAATPAPASATKAVRALETQLRSDIATFGTASTVSRAHLGQFLDSLTLRVAALNAKMTTLQHALHPAGAHH
jgi:hypothetical protein